MIAIAQISDMIDNRVLLGWGGPCIYFIHGVACIAPSRSARDR
jgi:hypothetical protein